MKVYKGVTNFKLLRCYVRSQPDTTVWVLAKSNAASAALEGFYGFLNYPVDPAVRTIEVIEVALEVWDKPYAETYCKAKYEIDYFCFNDGTRLNYYRGIGVKSLQEAKALKGFREISEDEMWSYYKPALASKRLSPNKYEMTMAVRDLVQREVTAKECEAPKPKEAKKDRMLII